MNWLPLALLAIQTISAAIDAQPPDDSQQRINFGRGWNITQSIEGFTTLGNAVRLSDYVAVMQLDERNPDDERWSRAFKTVEILKGSPGAGRHALNHAERRPPLRYSLDPRQPGRLAVAFVKDNVAAVCFGASWSIFLIAEPNFLTHEIGPRAESIYLSMLYVGDVDRLIQNVRDVAAGKEVVVAAEKNDVHPHLGIRITSDRPPLWRLKASLKIKDRAQTIRAANFVGMGACAVADLPIVARQLKHHDPVVRQITMNSLISLGPKAKNALPELWNCFADPEPLLRIQAAETALAIDPDDCLPLLAIAHELQSHDADVRNAAATSLNQCSEHAVRFLPQALAAFEREQAPFGYPTITLLKTASAQASPHMKRDIAALIVRKIRASDEDESYFRANAAAALLELGPEIEPAFPVLKRMVLQGSREIHPAAKALAQFAPDGPGFLGRLLDQPDYAAKDQVAQALGSAGSQAAPALPALYRLAHSDNNSLRFHALIAIRQIEPHKPHDGEEPSVEFYTPPVLSFRVGDRPNWPFNYPKRPSVETRRSMRYFLMRQIRNPNSDLPIAKMRDERSNSLRELASHGAEALDVAPELWRMLKGTDPSLRADLIAALWRIEIPSEVNGLRCDRRTQLLVMIKWELWRHRDNNLMVYYLPELPDFNTRGVALVPELARLCRSKNSGVARSAILSLRALGPAAKDALPDLIRAMDRDDRSVQYEAIVTYCKISSGHPLAVQRLREWCETEDLTILTELAPADLGKENVTPILLKAIQANGYAADRAEVLLKATDPEAAKKFPKRQQTEGNRDRYTRLTGLISP